jgi:glutamyl-tRNA(Gln) amidotransferase subunit D
MMSENMRFAHYNILAKEVEKEVKKGVDGIIITHGTDTMHYSSAALSFALENISVPVLLVGAQRSSDRGSSDAALNLLSAAYFMSESDFTGVGMCMHENIDDTTCLIIAGTKARKMHTSRRDAFRPINSTALARVDFANKSVEKMKSYHAQNSGKCSLKLFKEDLKVGLLKAHTNMYAQEFSAYSSFDGLVVEGTALGQLPNAVVDEHTKESGKILDEIKKLTKKMPVVMASQCLYGRIDMNVYSEGRTNMQAGILGNYSDMTSETTFIKLAWLLSNHKNDVAKLITKNLRGEISERIEDNDFLV